MSDVSKTVFLSYASPDTEAAHSQPVYAPLDARRGAPASGPPVAVVGATPHPPNSKASNRPGATRVSNAARRDKPPYMPATQPQGSKRACVSADQLTSGPSPASTAGNAGTPAGAVR